MSNLPIEFIARGLFVQSRHVLFCWNPQGEYGYLPGGHVEPHESAPAALAREMIEEAGLKTSVGPLLLTHENRFKARNRAHHELNLVFAAEIAEPGWVRMCHVAHSPRTAILRNQKGGKGLQSLKSGSKPPLAPPPPVVSREPHIEFRWLDAKGIRASTIYPDPVAVWLLGLLRGGLDSTAGLRASDAPTGQWLSTMR